MSLEPRTACAIGLSALLLGSCATLPGADWPAYGGNAAGQRHSALTQITPGNVGQLTEVWRFDAGRGGLQTSPLVIGGVLYGVATDQSVFALDAAGGKELWRFSSGVAGFQPVRGLSWWSDGQVRRLFAPSSHYLYALDPATGKPAPEFGSGGRIDLREGLGRDPATMAVFMTSPGIVWRDLLITGFRTGEGLPAAPGMVRAYDVRTGALRWSFDLIARDGSGWPGQAVETVGGANNWAGMALDEERGILFVPTGSAVPDFVGGQRPGDNRYANSLVALDATTGRLRWHFQTVHHDLLDRDLPAPPSLVTVTHGGRRIDAVAQASKQGLLFLFDRETGAPLFPIEERPVPQSTVPGESSSATQPFPVMPEPFTRQTLGEADLTRRTPEAHAAALVQFRQLHSGGPFMPLALDRKTVVFPGFDGGAEWGGAAVDPARGVIYLNANDVPWIGGLAVIPTAEASSRGESLYAENCASCHGADRSGAAPEFPPLNNLSERLSRAEVDAVVSGGKGRMPGFPQIAGSDRGALMDFIMSEDRAAIRRRYFPDGTPRELIAEFTALSDRQPQRYRFTGYQKFVDPDGYPAVTPPWGTLNAIDLNSGRTLWRVPLGEYPELTAQGLAPTGCENYGGPLLTSTGLLFIGATVFDRKFRAFSARDGRLLWQAALPFSGNATAITYAVGGRQFVVIATSGSRNRAGPQGSAYVAFALPDLSGRVK